MNDELRDKKGLTEEEFLASYNPDRYKKPSVAADMVIFSVDSQKKEKQELRLLLVKRGGHPFLGQWALPGGFVNEGESVEEAAVRELFEETHVDQGYLEQLQVFSDWGRDPRMWVMSCAQMALIDGSRVSVKAGDDARDARWFSVEWKLQEEHKENLAGGIRRSFFYTLKLANEGTLLRAHLERRVTATVSNRREEWRIIDNDGLAFDHAKIIGFALERLKKKADQEGIALLLMPEQFSVNQLRRVWEAISGRNLTEEEVRRKAEPFLEECREGEGLYQRRWEAFLR